MSRIHSAGASDDAANSATRSHHEAIAATLLAIARQYGTPAYAYDVRRLRMQAEKLRADLPDAVSVLYSLKANGSLGICDVLAECGLGADVASTGELVTAVEAGFTPEEIFVAGPCKSRQTIDLLRSLPESVVSIDSRSELELLASQELPNRAVLRLRPDFPSLAAVSAGPEARFGIAPEELPRCRDCIASGDLDVIGFHVFAGSQVLDSAGAIAHLRGTVAQMLRAAEVLGIAPELLNLGGGFGVPYTSCQDELALGPIGDALDQIVQHNTGARIALELGRYLVAQAGWYLTSVLCHQSQRGRPAVVVDGGTHQRADLCGLGLRCNADAPLVLDAPRTTLTETDVWGCLSLPADVLAEASPLPPLAVGNVLAFANAGAYGLCSSPTLFHGHPLPVEVAFDGPITELMRRPQPARSILEGQMHLRRSPITSGSRE